MTTLPTPRPNLTYVPCDELAPFYFPATDLPDGDLPTYEGHTPMTISLPAPDYAPWSIYPLSCPVAIGTPEPPLCPCDEYMYPCTTCDELTCADLLTEGLCEMCDGEADDDPFYWHGVATYGASAKPWSIYHLAHSDSCDSCEIDLAKGDLGAAMTYDGDELFTWCVPCAKEGAQLTGQTVTFIM